MSFDEAQPPSVQPPTLLLGVLAVTMAVKMANSRADAFACSSTNRFQANIPGGPRLLVSSAPPMYI